MKYNNTGDLLTLLYATGDLYDERRFTFDIHTGNECDVPLYTRGFTGIDACIH
jgi:hypothetical protein